MDLTSIIEHIAPITAITGPPGIVVALCYLVYTVTQHHRNAENRAFFLGYEAGRHDALNSPPADERDTQPH